MTACVADAVACFHRMSSELAQPRLPTPSTMHQTHSHNLSTGPHREQADWTRRECLRHSQGIIPINLHQTLSLDAAEN